MNTKPRNNKGCASIKNSNDRLQIVFSYGGKRNYISTGLSDNPLNRKAAQMMATQIDLDILSNNLDTSLAKYKPKSSLALSEPVAQLPLQPVFPNLDELWEKYTNFKSGQIEQSTLIRDYGKIEKRIAKMPSIVVEDSITIRDYLLKTYSAEIARRTLTQLNACCNWAVSSKLISANPFAGMTAQIKTKSKGKNSRNPFTREERDAIIAAFENDTYSPKAASVKSSHYAPYVKILFYTGMRPEEACALKKKHIIGDRIHIVEAIPVDVRITKATKTNSPRQFPINVQLKAILETLKLEERQPDNLILPSPTGKEISAHNFLNRFWKPIVNQLVKEGKVRQYLPQYNCRHTFITLALHNGCSVQDVAAISGNSAEIIYKHYAGVNRNLVVPEF